MRLVKTLQLALSFVINCPFANPKNLIGDNDEIRESHLLGGYCWFSP